MLSNGSCLVWLGALVIGAATGRADVLGTSTIIAEDPATGGRVRVISTVIDLPGGGATGARYAYEVTNLSYEPDPATTNGLSGLGFGGCITTPFDLSAPAGWNAEVIGTVIATFSRPFDLGAGLAPGGIAVFEFTGDQRFAPWVFGDLENGTTAFTHNAAGKTGVFSLLDFQTGLGPLVPVPAPGPVGAFLLAAVLTFARRRWE